MLLKPKENIIKTTLALQLNNITKIYKLYNKQYHRLVEVFFNLKKHKLFYANKNISLTLYRGETLGIIGVNGAGKSTLLKIIAGVIEQTAGEIVRYGKVVALLELGTGFNLEFSGKENIYLNGVMLGMSKNEIDKKLDKIINFSELGDFINEPMKTYSSGMIMRLAFSIAIHAEPDILIVDEALSVGDAHFSAKCTKELKKLKEKKLSIIYVSHDLNSLKLLCDRLILLNKGEVVCQGDIESVINKYNYLIATLDKSNTSMKLEKSNSYGTLEAYISSVKVYGKESETDIITSGEDAILEIEIVANENIKDQVVGILIRDKFGQDIFGTNSFYYDKLISLEKGKSITIIFELQFNFAPGKYSLTTALHLEQTHSNGCTHWLDKAAEFEVAGIKGKHYVGICRLEPTLYIKGKK